METNEKQKYYTLYEYNKDNNDITNLYDTTNREIASKKLGTTIKHLNEYCIKAQELFKNGVLNLPRLQDTRYFIVIDTD
jgi:hypothetical protein